MTLVPFHPSFFLSFFFFFFVSFKKKIDKGLGEQRERELSCPLVHSLNIHKFGIGNSIEVSHMHGSDPRTWAMSWCPPGWAFAGRWDQEQGGTRTRALAYGMWVCQAPPWPPGQKPMPASHSGTFPCVLPACQFCSLFLGVIFDFLLIPWNFLDVDSHAICQQGLFCSFCYVVFALCFLAQLY